MRVTASDYMSIEIYNKAYAFQLSLQQLFMIALLRTVILAVTDTSEGTETIPFADLINIIERNIDRLVAGGYRPSLMQDTMTWLGERHDLRALDYTDINRWFESMEMIQELIESISSRALITGNYTTGSDKTRQIIRAVNA